MKTRLFLLVLSLMLAVTLQAQTYNQLWKKVEQMEQKDLPRSVIAEAQVIYEKAKEERNVPQMMKAYLTMMTYRGNISPDSIPVDIKGLEAWAQEPATQLQDKAVLYSILGGIFIREDVEKGNRYLQLSLKDSLKLMEYPAEKLVPMVKVGETSQLYFDDNLYDLLARRAIHLWKLNQWNALQEEIGKAVQQTYQSLLHIYKVKGMRPAWLLTALSAYPQADEKQLREWIKEYGDLDVCAEVYLRLSTMYPRLKEQERLALVREGIRRYPRYSRINALKNEEREILNPSLHLVLGDIYPKTPLPVEVEYRNLKGLEMKTYRLNVPAELLSSTRIDAKNVSKYGTLLYRKHFSLPPSSDYEERKDTLTLEPLDVGIYYILAIPDGRQSAERGVLAYVSALQAIHRTLPNDDLEIVVLDKQSGHPVEDAQVNVYQNKGNGYLLRESHKANAEGVVILKKGKDRYVDFQVQTAWDKAMPISRVWLGYMKYGMLDEAEEHLNLFTDRSIYRPGQTVHYSGIVYSQLDDCTRAEEGGNYTIVLQDADGKDVAKQEVRTDAFGSFSGMFELPEYGKMGTWRLRTDEGMVTFRVEEYKRPTFEVMFDTVRTAYQPDDTIRVTGVARTFADVPVQGAVVRFSVVRLENNLWRMRGTETHRTTGETTTDVEGRFEVPVHFLPIAGEGRHWYYTYEVSADVTNLAGETQEGQLNLPLGSSSLRLFIPDWEGATILREEPKKLAFRVNNLVGTPVEAEVDYRVMSGNKLILEGKTMSNQEFMPVVIYALPSGEYQLMAEVKDKQGHICEQTIRFRLFSLKDKRLPVGIGVWSYQPSEEFGADGTATIYFGSSDKDVYLFYDVMYGDSCIERKRIIFSDSLMNFRYTYREEYGDGLNVSFAYLKNGELYTRDFDIKKPRPDKALQLKWKTFRDKLQPGTKETWTLSVLRPDGTPADAQLLATMYDASLDQLAPHSWDFGLAFRRDILRAYWRQIAVDPFYWGFTFPVKLLKYSPLTYSQLDVPWGLGIEERAMRMYKADAVVSNAVDMSDVVFEEEMIPLGSHTYEEVVKVEKFPEETDNVQFRSNFAETAFFYPQLRTDAEGDVHIEFTLPESLTEWKFMGLAHTKDMDYGSISAKAVASKDFMLQPNWPRFVRVGDQVSIAASLANLSEKDVSGIVRMEIFLPETEKVILSQKCPFEVKAGGTGRVSFRFDVSDKYEGLAVRMVADGGLFSDGEQCYLPVLSNKQQITESVLLNVNGKGNYAFSLENLFNGHSKTVSHPQMWVEFTGNPVWYAVQALKVVANPDDDNAFSWSSAYYANALLAHLAKTEPRIADSLRVEGLDARLKEAVWKMKDLQNADGSWSWYKGMSGSLYMTTSITQLLARLQQSIGTLSDAEVRSMYQKAFAYLNKQIAEEVNRMKEVEKNCKTEVEPSEWALQCLYIMSLDKRLNSQSDVTGYLVDKLAKMSGRLTIYGKALSAIILQEAGRPAEAKEFLQSLMQYSVTTEEMGRYFDTSKAYYSWCSYKIPTQVAAIEAVKRVANEEKTLEEMKQWLLKQKQAQTWENPIATMDAVYALLTTGKDWLANSGAVTIRLGKQLLHTP